MNKVTVVPPELPIPRIEVVYIGRHDVGGFVVRKVDLYKVTLIGLNNIDLVLEPARFESKARAMAHADTWAAATGFPVLQLRQIATTTYHLEPDQ